MPERRRGPALGRSTCSRRRRTGPRRRSAARRPDPGLLRPARGALAAQRGQAGHDVGDEATPRRSPDRSDPGRFRGEPVARRHSRARSSPNTMPNCSTTRVAPVAGGGERSGDTAGEGARTAIGSPPPAASTKARLPHIRLTSWSVALPVFVLVSFGRDPRGGCGDDANDSGSGTTEPRTSPPGGPEGTYRSTSGLGHDLVPVRRSRSDLRQRKPDRARPGCNTLGGSYRVTGSTLRSPGDMQSTMMACPPGYAEQDQWLTQFLTSGPTVALDGTTLTLTSGGVTMVLSAAPTGSAALEGTKWTLDTINEGSTASALPAGVEAPTLEFDAAGTRATSSPGATGGEPTRRSRGPPSTSGPCRSRRWRVPALPPRSSRRSSQCSTAGSPIASRVGNCTSTGDRGLIYLSR